MSTPNTAESAPQPIGFSSLAALRQRHAGLIEERRIVGETLEFFAQVAEFIHKARATGVVLDDDGERWSSQSLLDFWANVLDRVAYPAPDPTLAEFDPSLAPLLDDSLCPYLGLDAFAEHTHGLFFGRQRIVADLAQHLQAQQFLIVLGPSGSGKSSLVMGGLLPQLKMGLVPDSTQWHYYPPMVPGTNPLTRLARMVEEQAEADAEDIQIDAALFGTDGQHLRTLLDARGVPCLLIIDQFEELFTLVTSDQVRFAFITNLLNAIGGSELRHHLIITMRSDFEERITLLPQLQARFEQAQFRMTPLNASELREAIEQPALQIGLKFEAGVVDGLIHDALGEPAALPLLQFTLLKLWEGRDHNRVTLDRYRHLGGGRMALARTADALYESLIPEDQRALQRILLRLARPGEGLEVTSNRVRRQTLYHASEAPYRIDSVLDKLIKTRLVRLTPDEIFQDDRVEVAHEALIRNWPRLVEWIEEDRVTMRRRLRLTADAERWAALAQSQDALLRGDLLTDALRYDDLNELEQAYLKASGAAVAEEYEQQMQQRLEVVRAEERAELAQQLAQTQARSNRRLRYALGALALLLLFSVIAIAYAFDAQAQAQKSEAQAQTAQAQAESTAHEAQTAQALAEEKERVSTSLQLTISADTMSSQNPDLALLLGVEALTIADSPAVRAMLQRKLSEPFRPLAYLKGHPLGIRDVAFSPDSRLLASTSDDGLVLVWDTQTQQVVEPALLDDNHSALSVAFSPNGAWIATSTGNGDGAIILWDAETHEHHQRYRLFPNNFVLSSAFHPNSTMIAASGCVRLNLEGDCDTHEVKILDLDNGSNTTLPISSTKPIRALSFSPNERYLAVGGDDGNVYLWDMDAQQLRIVEQQGDDIWAVAFSANSQNLAASGQAGDIYLWDLDTNQKTSLDDEEINDINRLVWLPDGKTLVAADLDGLLSIWDTSSRQLRRFYTIHQSAVDALALSPDRTMIATGARDGQLILWDASQMSNLSTQAVAPSDYSEQGQTDLSTLMESSPRQELIGHPAISRSVAYSHNGTLIATGGDDGTVILRDALTRQMIGDPLKGDSDWIYSIAFSPDDQILAAASINDTVILWDIATQEQLGTLEGHTDYVYRIAFSPDGTLLASGSCHQRDTSNTCEQGEVRLWDVATCQQRGAPLLGHTDLIWSIAFGKDGLLATGSFDNTIRLWDTQTRQQLGDPLVGHTDYVYDLEFSPDGRLLASAGRDDTAIIWDVQTRSTLQILTDSTNSLNVVTFSPDGSELAGGGWDNQVRRWDVQTGRLLGIMVSAPSAVRDLAYSPDGTALASANDDGTLTLWDRTSGEMIGKPILAHLDNVRAAALSPDEKLLATGSENKTIILWDTTTGAAVHTLEGHTGYVLSLVFSPNSASLFSVGGDGTLRVWDVASGKQIKEISVEDSLTSVALSPDGSILATGGCQQRKQDGVCTTGEIRLWDVNGQTLHSRGDPLIGHSDFVWSLAFSPDGKLLASGGDEEVWLWNVANKRLLSRLKGHSDSVRSLAFSPGDGHLLASGAEDKQVILWQTAKRTRIGDSLSGHTGWVSSVAFTPDGQMLVSASGDTTIIFWNVHDQTQAGKLKTEHWDSISAMALGKSVFASAGLDGKIFLWGNQLSLAELACHVARRNLTIQEWEAYLPGKPYRLTCPDLAINKYALRQVIDEAVNMLQAGESVAATALIRDTADWARTTKNAEIANAICRYGSLGGFADSLESTCTYAIENRSSGKFRDSRGIMYAMLGNNPQAIKDFNAFIEWATKQDDADEYQAQIAERRRWIEVLESGENPFDVATIRQLQQGEE